MVLSDQWFLTLLITRAIAILIATARPALAFVGATLAVAVAGRPEPQGCALAKVWSGYRSKATLRGGAVAVATAHAPVSFALAGLALVVVLADGAKCQGTISARLTTVLPCNGCAADLARWTIAVTAADALAPLAMIRAAFRIPRACRAVRQVGPCAEIPPDRWLEATLTGWAVAVLVALAGTAEAATSTALVVDATRGTEREIAAPDERRIRDKGCVCLAERLCPRPHHIDGIVVPDVARRIVVVLKYRETICMASLMDDSADQSTECLSTIDPIVVADIDPIPQPAMGHPAKIFRVQAFARLSFRPFVLAGDVDARPFPNKFLAVVLANVGKFISDGLGPSVDVVGCYTDMLLGGLIALIDGIGQGRRCDKAKRENTQNSNE